MLRSLLRTSRWLARKQIDLIPNAVVRVRSFSFLDQNQSFIYQRNFASSSDNVERSKVLDQAVFEEICNETLESLSEYFEELVEQAPNLKGADITFSDGVLTVALGNSYGTYVINRQTPNKQIWLSSPVSGPKRYDLVLKNGGYWIYKHDGVSLHKLLQDEISKIVKDKVEFNKCTYSVV
ncbi:frataxin homolog, mitochondrial [Plodia interpunctella]|uniref:frataxin homolog, mitochondrial n=1 Tax=Plodia interpunctella TaxID=58824 RepID=UPI002367577A|nr:frataxin homolog, mitochondrial [Plodia interpunctella]